MNCAPNWIKRANMIPPALPEPLLQVVKDTNFAAVALQPERPGSDQVWFLGDPPDGITLGAVFWPSRLGQGLCVPMWTPTCPPTRQGHQRVYMLANSWDGRVLRDRCRLGDAMSIRLVEGVQRAGTRRSGVRGRDVPVKRMTIEAIPAPAECPLLPERRVR